MTPINLKAIADAHGVPYRLVGAIVQVESAGDTWATRYEPGYRWLWDVEHGRPWTVPADIEPHYHVPPGFPAPRGVTRATEFIAQRTSWGLMQVMGAVAREQGAEYPYLSVLCDPATGIKHGCQYLATLRRWHGLADGQLEALAAAYNAGAPRKDANGEWRNQEYVGRIRAAGGFR